MPNSRRRHTSRAYLSTHPAQAQMEVIAVVRRRCLAVVCMCLARCGAIK